MEWLVISVRESDLLVTTEVTITITPPLVEVEMVVLSLSLVVAGLRSTKQTKRGAGQS